jgi:hypothetical protein
MFSQGSSSDMAFPWKLHEMLDRIERDDKQSIVSWMPSGKSFKVHKREAFSKDILPLYFRHSHFKSFQRNLSIYQFTRIWSGPERGSYQHTHLVRGNRSLCLQITRRGSKTTPSSSQSMVSHNPEETSGSTTIHQHQHAPRMNDLLGLGMLDNDGNSSDMMQAWNMLSEEDSTESSFVSKDTRTINNNNNNNNNKERQESFLSPAAGAQQQKNELLASNDAQTIAWMLQEGVSTSDLMEILLDVNNNQKSTMPRGQSIQAYSDDIISLFSNNESVVMASTTGPRPASSTPTARTRDTNRRHIHQQQSLPYQSRTNDNTRRRLLPPAPKLFDTLPAQQHHQQQQGLRSRPQIMPLNSLLDDAQQQQQPFVAFPITNTGNRGATTFMSTKIPHSMESLDFFNVANDNNDDEALSLNIWE